MNYNIEEIIADIIKEAERAREHNYTVSQIEQVFKKHGFYTTREYPIYKIQDGNEFLDRIGVYGQGLIYFN